MVERRRGSRTVKRAVPGSVHLDAHQPGAETLCIGSVSQAEHPGDLPFCRASVAAQDGPQVLVASDPGGEVRKVTGVEALGGLSNSACPVSHSFGEPVGAPRGVFIVPN